LGDGFDNDFGDGETVFFSSIFFLLSIFFFSSGFFFSWTFIFSGVVPDFESVVWFNLASRGKISSRPSFVRDFNARALTSSSLRIECQL
jgi:hypothetical protein